MYAGQCGCCVRHGSCKLYAPRGPTPPLQDPVSDVAAPVCAHAYCSGCAAPCNTGCTVGAGSGSGGGAYAAGTLCSSGDGHACCGAALGGWLGPARFWSAGLRKFRNGEGGACLVLTAAHDAACQTRTTSAKDDAPSQSLQQAIVFDSRAYSTLVSFKSLRKQALQLETSVLLHTSSRERQAGGEAMVRTSRRFPNAQRPHRNVLLGSGLLKVWRAQVLPLHLEQLRDYHTA